MSRLSFAEMNIDLTQELAMLMKLSVSDKWFIGSSFIKEYSKAIIANDVKMVRALTNTYENISFPQPDNWYRQYNKEVLSVFRNIKLKLHKICSVTGLIECMEIQREYAGWGGVIITDLLRHKSEGIDFINLDAIPYKYAEGAMPVVEYWCEQELKRNSCPFTQENAVDYFFDLVKILRKNEASNTQSEIYSFMSSNGGLRIINRLTETRIR